MHKIIIPGKPIAKARPRFARRGKYVTTYSEQETEEGKALLFIREQWHREPIIGPVMLSMFFFLPRPKGHYGTGRNAGKLKPSAPTHHVKKPDVSNMVKFYEDVMNGIVWKDDSQIIASLTRKEYSVEPRTEILVEGVFEDDIDNIIGIAEECGL